MLPGEHTYTFYFLPAQYLVGAAISVITIVLMLIIWLAPVLRQARSRFRNQLKT